MIEYTTVINNIQVTGDPIVLVKTLKENSFESSQKPIDEFIKEIQFNTWRLFGIGINIDHSQVLYNKCESLIKQLINNKLLPSL